MRTRASTIRMLAELSNTEFTPDCKSITSVATGPLTRSRQRYYLRARLPERQRYYLRKRLPKLRRRLPGIPKLGNPKLVRYKRQGCPNFELMKAVFSRSTATGSGRHASTHAPVSPVNEPLSEDVQYNMGPVHVDLEQDPPSYNSNGLTTNAGHSITTDCSWEACS
ncbi:hypothetical protein CJ030_MR7G028025 [Morella rubra]|uniref:Uncharacterized protein n=1 Tax=Morella rubra TaxID=262757 RepID=A0A6A1V3K2_9ROSI|nr:hypothetical protein CJ030_MR7G028025 [Morella rubra]